VSRRGFALLAVLWVLTALTATVGAGLLVARVGSDTTRNRVLLARAEWAREACGEILQARFAADRAARLIDTIDLGRNTWCRATLDDPSAKLNLNTAESAQIARLFLSARIPQRVADTVIAQRRAGPLDDVRQVRGLDSTSAARLASVVTTRGTGVVNVNAAPPEVLRVLPGMTQETVMLLVSRRSNRPVENAEQLAGMLSPSARGLLLDRYAEFVRASVFSPPQLVAVLEGGVLGTPIIARATLTVVAVPGRLAVIRRETE